MPRNAFYAQSGGVTAVINASAAGVIEAARKHKAKIGKLYAGRNGILGALNEDLIDTSRESAAAIRALSDEELDNAATVSLNADAPLTCQFFLEDHAVRHSYHHLAKIVATLKR